MSDLIDRHAAIDALKTDMASLDHIIQGMSGYDVRLDAYVSQRNQINYDIDTINNLPTAQPEPHWIPCSERLPKIEKYHTSKTCLVYCKIGEEGDWDYIYDFAELEENIFGQVGWSCERDDEYHEPLGEVIAWMPLPEPFKEVTDGRD